MQLQPIKSSERLEFSENGGDNRQAHYVTLDAITHRGVLIKLEKRAPATLLFVFLILKSLTKSYR